LCQSVITIRGEASGKKREEAGISGNKSGNKSGNWREQKREQKREEAGRSGKKRDKAGQSGTKWDKAGQSGTKQDKAGQRGNRRELGVKFCLVSDIEVGVYYCHRFIFSLIFKSRTGHDSSTRVLYI
jgi:hypothetical protein